jgi:Tfp pilus assembly protein PilF
MRGLAWGVFGAAFVASAAAAQTQEQTYGFNAIQRHDLTAAEARLVAQRTAEPNEPSVLINLAHVYSKTGRVEQAEALYRQVLASDKVMLATANRDGAWSHDLAQRGLARARMMASR